MSYTPLSWKFCYQQSKAHYSALIYTGSPGIEFWCRLENTNYCLNTDFHFLVVCSAQSQLDDFEHTTQITIPVEESLPRGQTWQTNVYYFIFIANIEYIGGTL